MSPSMIRSFGAASAAGFHLPSVHSPFSLATAMDSMSSTSFSRTRYSVEPRSLSRIASCPIPSALGWKSGALGAGFACVASAAAEGVPGHDHQMSHFSSAVRSLCNSREAYLYDVACMSRSYEQQRVDVDNAGVAEDKLLIDCGPDQECVTGGIVALGKFDALHTGHRELAIQASKAGTPFLLSFAGMAEVLGWEKRAPIVARCDRKRVLTSWAPLCGDFTPLEYHVEFTKVRHLSPRDFVEKLSKELGIVGVVAGENYRFGYRAAGDASDLVRLCKEYGMDAYILSPVLDSRSNSESKEWVSSTRVRQALSVGDMKYVSELLGRRHRLVLAATEEHVMELNKLSIPISCLLNQRPKDGFYESCCLLIDDKFVGSCRVVIDTECVHVELDGTFEVASSNWNGQQISIEFA